MALLVLTSVGMGSLGWMKKRGHRWQRVSGSADLSELASSCMSKTPPWKTPSWKTPSWTPPASKLRELLRGLCRRTASRARPLLRGLGELARAAAVRLLGEPRAEELITAAVGSWQRGCERLLAIAPGLAGALSMDGVTAGE